MYAVGDSFVLQVRFLVYARVRNYAQALVDGRFLKVANVSPRDLFSGFTGRAGTGVNMLLQCTVSAYVAKMYSQCLCCRNLRSVPVFSAGNKLTGLPKYPQFLFQ